MIGGLSEMAQGKVQKAPEILVSTAVRGITLPANMSADVALTDVTIPQGRNFVVQ